MKIYLVPLKRKEEVRISAHADDRQLSRRSAEVNIPDATDSTVQLPPMPPGPPGSIDLESEKEREAASILNRPAGRAFGPPNLSSTQVPQESTTVHKYGETYKNEFGETIVWASNRCYIVSESPSLSAPNIVARVPTHTVCVRHRRTDGELLKTLPEYKKPQL